jgi:hypothetical protein
MGASHTKKAEIVEAADDALKDLGEDQLGPGPGNQDQTAKEHS